MTRITSDPTDVIQIAWGAWERRNEPEPEPEYDYQTLAANSVRASIDQAIARLRDIHEASVPNKYQLLRLRDLLARAKVAAIDVERKP